jgi:hypothetical protein
MLMLLKSVWRKHATDSMLQSKFTGIVAKSILEAPLIMHRACNAFVLLLVLYSYAEDDSD